MHKIKLSRRVSTMISTPSTRRLLDGVVVGVWAPDSLVDYAQAILASETTLKELVTVAAHGETPSGPTGAVNLVMRLAEALDVRADDVSAGKFRATRYRLKGEPADGAVVGSPIATWVELCVPGGGPVGGHDRGGGPV